MGKPKSISGFFVGAACLSILLVGGIAVKYLIPAPKPYGFDHPDRVLAASVLLETLEEETSFMGRKFRPSFLPEAELEVVKTELRSRYPFQSLRERLHFQTTHPKPVVRKQELRGPRDYADGFFSQRSRAIGELHSDTVHDFINRAGQGMMRSPPPEPADLRLWEENTNQLKSEPVDSKILGEATIPLDGKSLERSQWWPEHDQFELSESGLPKRQIVEAFHLQAQNGFARKNTLGYVENVDRTSGFESHRVRFPIEWNAKLRPEFAEEQFPSGIYWKLNRLQLVGLLMHDKPVVYVSDQLPNMEELSSADAPTRPLEDFESTSLEALLAGEKIVTRSTANRIIMMGAIRAGESCLECHSVKKDDLLGAFSYELLRKPEADLSKPVF